MLLMGAFVQSLVEGGDVAAARANLVMAAAAAIVVRVCCLTLSQRMGQAAAAAAKRTVRKLVYDKLVRLGPSYSERVSTSEAVQVSVEGTEQLESYFGSYLPQLFYSVLAPLTLFACLAPLCFPAAVALLACVPLIPASIVAVQKIAKRAMGSYWDAYTDLGATFLENLQGLTTLKIYRVDADRHEAMNREAETFRQATMRLLRMQLNSVTVMDVFAYGGAAVGIVMALWQFSLGQAPFFAAFAVIFLAAEFFIPLRTLGSFFHTAMNGMAAADKMFAILDAPEPKRGSRVIEADRISFACRGVGYSYDGERTVLSDVDFDAAAGSFTGIVGESGSGKSTLAGILSGRNAGFAGSVEVGGVPIQEASRASLASTVTVVPFSSYLFKGSVRSNLLLADPQASDEELWEALRRCRAEGFVEQAGGLDAAIAEEGGNLSGGQRQRLALARALLRDTPAYVFDEATSNVDAESERAIVEVVHELARTKTVVVISHRLAAVAGADRIYVLEDGRVAEAGTHGELLEHGGPYARLWSRQAELERFSAAVEAAGSEEELPEASPAVSGGSARAAAEPARCPDCPAHGRRGEEPAPVEPTRRSHLSVMLRLVGLVRPLAPWMALAVVLGVLGFGGGHLPHGVRGLRARRSGGLSADCRLRRRAGARGRLRRRARASALRRAAVQPLSRVQAVGARARPRVRRAAPLGSGEAGRPRQRRPCFACDRRYRIAGSVLCSHVVPGDHRVRRVCGHDGVRRDDISGAGVAGSCILPAGGRSGAVRLLEGQRHGRARAAGGGWAV